MSGSPCPWPGDDPLYIRYHDREWGVPEWDDRALFEKLTLDGFQAGLSWILILRRREGFRAAFDGFDPERIAAYDDRDVEARLHDARIVRHRGKIEATVGNARAWLSLRERRGSFAEFLWDVVGGEPQVNRWQTQDEVPARTSDSERMSRRLRAEGFRFVGPTLCYAFMQSVGMVNDHLEGCFRWGEVAEDVHLGSPPDEYSVD